MKKDYEKPAVSSQDAFETLAAGCTFFTDDDPACNSAFDPSYSVLNS
jgi:hypothetical protein